eukprot:653419-Prorocentrum_lima.AAC.1
MYSRYCQSVFTDVSRLGSAPGSDTGAVVGTGCCTQSPGLVAGKTSSMWGGGCLSLIHISEPTRLDVI